MPPLITRVTIHVHVSPVLSRDVCPFTVGQRPPPNRQKWRQASGTVEFRGPKQITNIASPVHVKTHYQTKKQTIITLKHGQNSLIKYNQSVTNIIQKPQNNINGSNTVNNKIQSINGLLQIQTSPWEVRQTHLPIYTRCPCTDTTYFTINIVKTQRHNHKAIKINK